MQLGVEDGDALPVEVGCATRSKARMARRQHRPMRSLYAARDLASKRPHPQDSSRSRADTRFQRHLKINNDASDGDSLSLVFPIPPDALTGRLIRPVHHDGLQTAQQAVV